MNINLRPILFVTLLFAANTYAQQQGDSMLYKTPVNNAISYFKKTVDLQSGLYNGEEYVFYSRKKGDNAFFQNQEIWDNSTLNYDGTTYTNVPLMYDVFKDQVVGLLYNKSYNYILVSSKIDDFTLLGHKFVYKYSDSLNTNGIETGIYDQLYNGKTEVIVRRKKIAITATRQQITYVESNKLFVKKGDVYFEAGGRVRLLKILKDKKKELRSYINNNNIDFKDLEPAVINVVAYYDKLTQ